MKSTTENPISPALRSEEALVRAAQSGDERAFDELMRRHQDALYKQMTRACCNIENAEEVAIEAFARAHQKLSQFEGRSSFVTWVGHIARNLCWRLKEKNRPTLSLDESANGEQEGGKPGNLPELAAQEPGPEQDALRAEMKRQVRAAIDALPELDRHVLQLRDIENLSAQETAALLDISVPAVKARLHRARRALRESLNEYFLDGASL